MNARDKAIIADLERFRCMTREDITAIHFEGVKTAVHKTNGVMKRLVREGLAKVSKERRMYIYFPERSIKINSQKINHYLAIVQFYREIRRIREPERFIPEPNYGKGFPEPDVELIWYDAPWFVEIQRNAFSKETSFERYEKYFRSRQWEELPWQTDPPEFPYVWVCGVGNYNTEKKRDIQIFHSDIPDLVLRLEKKLQSQRGGQQVEVAARNVTPIQPVARPEREPAPATDRKLDGRRVAPDHKGASGVGKLSVPASRASQPTADR